MSFEPPNPFQTPSDGVDVITTTTTAARTRNAGELSAKIKAAGGALVTDVNSSDYIVAVNNSLRYSITRLANGQYRVTESSSYYLLIGGLILIGAMVFLKQ